MTMPILPLNTMLDGFNDQEKRILSAAFTSRGVKIDGAAKLRASKPYADKKVIDGQGIEAFEMGCANYVWRMLCFDLVGSGKHVCMPVCADFAISWALDAMYGCTPRYGTDGYEAASKERRELKRELTNKMNELIKRFESVLPVEAQKGIIRWGRALGMI